MDCIFIDFVKRFMPQSTKRWKPSHEMTIFTFVFFYYFVHILCMRTLFGSHIEFGVMELIIDNLPFKTQCIFN